MKRSLIMLFTLVVLMLFMTGLNLADTGYVGQDSCKGCHENSFASYATSVHAKKAVPGSPGSGQGCESCHGSGSAHAEKRGGKGTGMISFNRQGDAGEKAKKCLQCHEASKELTSWSMSRHNSVGLSCDDCHSVHSGGAKNLKKKQPDLCFDCHRDISSQTNRQSHHPIVEGKVSCTDCHDPHGDFGAKMLKGDSVNELCYSCHAEKRGPYMWQHPPVEENCLNCHVAHGSNHSKLLSKRMPYLCQDCHVEGSHPRSAYGSASTFEPPNTSSNPNRLVARSCLNCHSNIHGSNGPHGASGPYFVR